MHIIFVIGGARSGKSSFALQEASLIQGQKVYIATAEAMDDEMKDRITRHRKERSSVWATVEEPVNITEAIAGALKRYEVVLLDCLTLWLSNVMRQDGSAEQRIEHLVRGLQQMKGAADSDRGTSLYLVSNEVGMGIVPENKLARQFRDLAGMLNRKAAEIADEAYLVTAGIPVKIKGQK